MKIAEVSSCV